MNMNTKPKTLLAALRRIPVGAWVALVLSAGVSLASEPGHRTVTGRLVAPADCRWNLGETKSMLQEQLPPFPIPPEVKAKGRNAEDEWFQMWKTTEEARAFFDRPRRKYDVSVSSDGSFAIEKVVPGDYWFFYTLPDSLENEPVSMGHKAFSLSPGAAPWALGEIRMTVLPHLGRGERAPQFEVRALDGTALSLQSCEGKVAFLHFWSTQCAACLAEMPEITKLHAELGETPGFVMLGFNLDENRQKARDYIAGKKLVWPQALLGSWKHEIMRDFHVIGIPSSFLLDPQGKVVATHLRGDQLLREIRRCLADARAPGGSGDQPSTPATR
jgi:thiol-disulfide isomerase/thioredoxin